LRGAAQDEIMDQRRILSVLGGAALVGALVSQTPAPVTQKQERAVAQAVQGNEAGEQKEDHPAELRIESIFGHGFGIVFEREVILERGLSLPGTMAAEHGSPFWIARIPGSNKTERVKGQFSGDQKDLENWAKDHPKVAVKVLAYETIEAKGCPSVTREVGNCFPAWQDVGWSAQPILVIVKFEQ